MECQKCTLHPKIQAAEGVKITCGRWINPPFHSLSNAYELVSESFGFPVRLVLEKADILQEIPVHSRDLVSTAGWRL